MAIRVLLADDHEIVRKGLTRILERGIDVQVVAEAKDGREAVALALEYEPDVVIMDIKMPELDGPSATRKILSKTEGIAVLALSGWADVESVVSMIRAGAVGYVVKDSSPEEIVTAITIVASGGSHFCSSSIEIVRRDYRRLLKNRDRHTLSPRELEVVRLIAKGKATKEIASLLDISIKTVETYRSNIAKKLDVGGVAEITRYAVRTGIIDA